MKGEWPFEQPQNCAVISLRDIVFGGKPILFVSHDDDDDSWQFLTDESPREENAVVVGLGEIAKRDPTVLELADLPPGWIATRDNADANWERRIWS